MAVKPKAGGVKKKPSNKANKEIPKTQSERFIETARAIGSDETGKDFEQAVNRIIKQGTFRNKKSP